MSDGKVLEKTTFIAADHRIDHATGWTVPTQLSKGETPEQWLLNYTSKNWERTITG